MRVIRLAGMLLVAVVAMSFVVVSSASAAESPNPLFIPATGQAVTGSGGESVLTSAGIVIACKENKVISGNVANSLLIGGIVIHYLGCTVTKGEAESGCPAFSTGVSPAGETEGLILTKTIHGILGIELPGNKTVVVFLPQAGKEFTTLAETKKNGKVCRLESAVSGSVAGLITPVGEKSEKFTVTVGGPPKLVHLTHNLGLVTAKLVAFGGTAELGQTDSVTVAGGVEVT
jgi:hypothetical protein